MALIEKFRDPEPEEGGREWLAFEKTGVLHVREYGTPRGVGESIAGLGSVLDEQVTKGNVIDAR